MGMDFRLLEVGDKVVGKRNHDILDSERRKASLGMRSYSPHR